MREAHYRFGTWRKNGTTKTGKQRWHFKAVDGVVMFPDKPPPDWQIGTQKDRGNPVGRWWKRPSIFLPRAASRLIYIVTATKIERVQAISEADAMAEGVEPVVAGTMKTYRAAFVRLWADLHGAASWLDNPEIVALTFVVDRRNIGAQGAA